MNSPISLTLPDGRSSRLLVFAPEGAARAPAVLVIHEWWGVNEDIQDHARRLAAQGFLAVVPDLYFGEATSDPKRALELSAAMRTEEAMAIVAAAAEALASHPASSGKVGITGFCLGGAMALAAACTVPGIAAAVPFYGTPRDAFVRFSSTTPPIQGHYAEVDPFVDAARVRSLHEAAESAGARFELFFYPAGHAFLRRGDPSAFHAPSAELAWDRAVTFLRTTLA